MYGWEQLVMHNNVYGDDGGVVRAHDIGCLQWWFEENCGMERAVIMMVHGKVRVKLPTW